jgi:hypothetical protein
MKQDFAPIDRKAILGALERLPISTWSYRSEESKARHIGPMAQDFIATFNVGSSDKTILQVDADGVALAAIQALYEEIKDLEKRNAALARELEAVRAQVVPPAKMRRQR